MEKRKRGLFFYGWVIVAVTFIALLGSAGVRNAACAMVVPLAQS